MGEVVLGHGLGLLFVGAMDVALKFEG